MGFGKLILLELEQRDQRYLLRLRQTANVKRLTVCMGRAKRGKERFRPRP
jgi:hypothetical protein